MQSPPSQARFENSSAAGSSRSCRPLSDSDWDLLRIRATQVSSQTEFRSERIAAEPHQPLGHQSVLRLTAARLPALAPAANLWPQPARPMPLRRPSVTPAGFQLTTGAPDADAMLQVPCEWRARACGPRIVRSTGWQG